MFSVNRAMCYISMHFRKSGLLEFWILESFEFLKLGLLKLTFLKIWIIESLDF